MMSKPCCCWNSIQKPSSSFGVAVRKTSSSSSSSFAKEQRRSLRLSRRRRISTYSSYDNDYEDIDDAYEDDDDAYDDDSYDDDEEKGSIDSEETNIKKFNLALAFDDDDDDDDDEVAKRFLVSSIYRMASEENLYTGTLINTVYVLKSIDNKIRIKSDFKTVVLDFRRRRRRRTGGGFGDDDDDDDDDDVKYVKVFHDDGDDNKLVGKKGKLVSLLPPSSDINTTPKTNPSITKLLKLITVNVLQNRNLVKTGPHDFLAYHLFASSLGAFKKRSGALNARRKIREGYVRLCLSQNAENDSKENTINYYIFFNLSSQTSKWNALQAYESFRLKNNNNNIKVIPVALVYGENNEENETIDRSSFVWIFNNRNHIHDFYQCVYADSGWREAETLIFAKKNNKNTWPERFRKDLLLEFPKRRDLERTTPSVITVAAFAQGVAKSSIVFIAPNMLEKNNNHKNDCTLRKLFQSAGITFTGTSAAFATRAADRVFLSSALNNSKVKIPGVMGIPKKVILQSALTVMAEEYVEKNEFLSSVSNIQRAVRTYAEATKELNCAELCIKSQFFEQNSSKITRIRSAKDLETFAYECRRNRRFSSNNNIQNNFILEPFVETGKVVDFQFVQREESLSESRWLKIYVGGIGPEGKMKALDPACPVGVPVGRRKGKTHAYLDCVKDGKTKKLLFDEKKIESVVKPRIERVLNLTGISGVAMLRCFVNVDSGELIVEDVDHSPDMTERNGTFYHQALRYFHREERDNDLYGKDERSINSSSSSSSSISTNDGEDDVKNDEKSIEAIDKIAIKKGLENTSFFTRLIAIAMFK